MNTDWIIGFVAYTGKETRIMMNSQSVGALKQSSVERMMNKFTIYIVISLLVLTLTLAIIGGFWHSEASHMQEQSEDSDRHFYLQFARNSITAGFFTFVMYF